MKYDESDQHRYPSAQTKADRQLRRSKVWRKIAFTFLGVVVGVGFGLLINLIRVEDNQRVRQDQIERQHTHEQGIANCKAQHGTIQLDQLGWYIGCLIPTRQS